jgi:flagellar capping protein FliD
MNKLPILREKTIASFIYFIRGEKVMLDTDLAKLYNVETRVLKQAVRRNIKRFPSDFMFELSDKEMDSLVSQNVIPSKKVFGGAKPFAFTEQGIAMLSSILNSDIAVQVNIAILRTFVKIRQLLEGHKDLVDKIDKLEQKYDEQFRIIFTALQQMLKEENEPKPKIGFKLKGK